MNRVSILECVCKLECNDCGVDSQLFQYKQDSPSRLLILCKFCAECRVADAVLNTDFVTKEEEE